MTYINQFDWIWLDFEPATYIPLYTVCWTPWVLIVKRQFYTANSHGGEIAIIKSQVFCPQFKTFSDPLEYKSPTSILIYCVLPYLLHSTFPTLSRELLLLLQLWPVALHLTFCLFHPWCLSWSHPAQWRASGNLSCPKWNQDAKAEPPGAPVTALPEQPTLALT